MASVPALGLSVPSCTVKFLEVLIPWCLEVAVLSGSAVGACTGLPGCSLAQNLSPGLTTTPHV